MAERRVKRDTFSINVQRYSQNHEIAFSSHTMGIRGNKSALSQTLLQRNSEAEFH